MAKYKRPTYGSCTALVEGEAPKFLAELTKLSAKYGLVLMGDVGLGIDETADPDFEGYVLIGGANGRVEFGPL